MCKREIQRDKIQSIIVGKLPPALVYRGRVESEDQWSVTRPTDTVSHPASLQVPVMVIIRNIHDSHTRLLPIAP